MSADFVSISRPLIRQPDLPSLWRSGEGPDKAECISCNACLPAGNARLACRGKEYIGIAAESPPRVSEASFYLWYGDYPPAH
ncbi:MAG: hypothetical protein ACLP9S_11985 [Syntrophales bacterium]